MLRVFLLGLVSLLVASQQAQANDARLKMFIWSNQLSPIISHQNSDVTTASLEDYEGIVVDILSSMEIDFAGNVQVMLSSRRRGELSLYDGKLDFTILSPRWLSQPDKLLYSLPIYIHREHLYSKEVIPNKPLADIIVGATVCTRLGYNYPAVQQYFDSGTAFRLDSQEEIAQFRLLMRGRCDFVLTNEYVATSILKEMHWQERVFVSDLVVDEVDFTFAFHPKHSALLTRLNAHISGLDESGELKKINERHFQK